MDDINHEHHYQIMREVLWSDKFTGKTVGRIRWNIEKLMILTEFVDYSECSKTELEATRTKVKEYVLSSIWFKYVTKKPYLKYTDEYALSTYLVRYMDYAVYHVLKEFIPDDKEKSLGWKGDIMKERYMTMRGEFHDNIQGEGNPEDELERKEFYEIASGFLKEVDFEVLEGRVSREEAAKELGISYDAYKKALSRRMAKLGAVYGKTGKQ